MSIVATLVVESSNVVVMFSNIVVSVATVYQKAVSLGELGKLNYSTLSGGFLLHTCYTLLLKARSLTCPTRIFSFIFLKYYFGFFLHTMYIYGQECEFLISCYQK